MPSSRVAVVTGAAHGIGRATAEQLAFGGWRVAAVDNDAETLRAASLPEDVLRVEADVADAPEAWLRQIVTDLGPISDLVNNVAMMDGRSFLDLPMDALRRTFDVTVFGTWALTRAVVEQMLQENIQGSLVFNLSLHASRVRMCPDYSTAKAALSMLVKELTAELGPHGIRVNAVSPGVVDTWSDRVPNAPEHRARSKAMVPLRSLGTPEDVAKAIIFLLDPASGYISGADIHVDGGLDQFNWLHHLYGSAAAERDRVEDNRRG